MIHSDRRYGSNACILAKDAIEASAAPLVQRGMALTEALAVGARKLIRTRPELAFTVAEALGCYPASDATLRALQVAWENA